MLRVQIAHEQNFTFTTSKAFVFESVLFILLVCSQHCLHITSDLSDIEIVTIV